MTHKHRGTIIPEAVQPSNAVGQAGRRTDLPTGHLAVQRHLWQGGQTASSEASIRPRDGKG